MSLDVVPQVPSPVSTFVSPPSQVDAVESVELESSLLLDQPVVATITQSHSQSQSMDAVAQAAPPVRINLAELSARIAGYHEGLNEVETVLLTVEADDFQALTDQIRQLDEMTRDFQFIKMYYDALTDNETRTVVSPRPMTATLAEIERRLDRSQPVQSGDFLEEFDSSKQAQIAKLRRQLSEVASRVNR